MNKMLSIAGALSLATTALAGFATSASAQQAPPSKDQIIEYCRALAANTPLDSPQFGNCVGFWNSNPHALPAQTCKFYREAGFITQAQFPDCITFFRDQGL